MGIFTHAPRNFLVACRDVKHDDIGQVRFEHLGLVKALKLIGVSLVVWTVRIVPVKVGIDRFFDMPSGDQRTGAFFIMSTW